MQDSEEPVLDVLHAAVYIPVARVDLQKKDHLDGHGG
jgi:hypothetical protein